MIKFLQKFFESRVSRKQYLKIRKIYRKFFSVIYANDLNKLAIIQRTDKNESHYYTQHYQKHFFHLRNKKINVLEIGVGGQWDKPEDGGASLRMWKSFFPKANIYGIDIEDKKFLEEPRIKTFQGDQSDEVFLNKVIQEVGVLDIIVDDGSHISSHMIKSFETLFPRLKIGGYYVIEDLAGALMIAELEEKEDVLNNPELASNFCKALVDTLNYKQFANAKGRLRFYNENIVAIHFYHGMVIIEKGVNNENSFILEKVYQKYAKKPEMSVTSGD